MKRLLDSGRPGCRLLRGAVVWAGVFMILEVDRRVFSQGVHVTTYHNDNARSGRNLRESQLSPATVEKDTFGLLFRLKVDSDVYAQPLFLSGVPIGGKAFDVVYVATERDSVYAFDAGTGNQLWRTSFLNEPTVTTMTSTDVSCGNIRPDIGITGTPVIKVDASDLSKSTLYVVAKTKEMITGRAVCVQRLHALDVVGGAERPNSPVTIGSQVIGGDVIETVSIRGSGTGSNIPREFSQQGDNDRRGNVRFFPLQQNQRPGLLLANDTVYIGWASHCDNTPYHGWLIGYDASTLKLTAVFNSTPSGGRGGIWASGAAPAADLAGNIYFSTGNGTFDSELNDQFYPSRGNYGDSVVKLAVDSPAAPNINGWGLRVVDYFTPFDQAQLGVDPEDFDLGSGGVILLDDQPSPLSHLLVLAGKKGVIYVLNRDRMGKFSPDSDVFPPFKRTVQRIPVDPSGLSVIGDAYGMPAQFGSTLFMLGAPRRDKNKTPIGGERGTDTMKAFTIAGSKLVLPPTSQTVTPFAVHTHSPSVSAKEAVGGIVWIITFDETDATNPAILHAYDATNLANELYNSEQVVVAGMPRDRAGPGIKFTVPTIANGKVFVGCQGQVTVYGKLAHP
jgi:hypothetical protein